MNTCKLLVSGLMLLCVLLAACAPAVTAMPTPSTETPTVLLGDSISEKYLNVDYLTGDGKQLSALRLRLPSDPICQELNTQGNCFTILLPNKPTDAGVRGPAALVDGLIAAKFQLCPFCDSSDVGSIEYFEPKENGGILTGVKCETKAGAACNADVGTTWKSAPQQTTFHSPENASFHLPLAFTYGPEWNVQVGINTLGIIHEGNPPENQSKWWSTGITLVNGALVHDPADVVSDQSAKANKADFVTWPADFFAYITSLPGVKIIQGPEPVTIGGLQGSQIIVHTPAMHPILWLKGDYSWLGGGASGVDPEFKRQMILVEVKGERILLEFDDNPEKFDERYPLVQEIFNSITFTK